MKTMLIRVAVFVLCWASTFAALISTVDLPASDEFNEYITKYARTYSPRSAEYHFRKALFQSRLEEITVLNSHPGKLWTAGVNEFTDQTDKERATRLGYRHIHSSGSSSSDGAAMLDMDEHATRTPATKVDWRHLKSTNASTDQGSCGSCWAFATIGMLHARLEIAGYSGKALSVQQLVSCVENPQECGGTGKCKGATVELAVDYLMKNKLVDEKSVPYEAMDGSCDSKWSSRGTSIGVDSMGKLPKNDYAALFAAVNDGPVAISADASDWFSYMGGIFTGCSKFNINHAIVLFGYGSESETKYWLIKNSWGDEWGEGGFGRFIRKTAYDDKADCGIDTKPADGTACKPYPDTDTACGCNGMFYDSVAVKLISRNLTIITNNTSS